MNTNLTAKAGWIARKADGTTDFNGFRFASFDATGADGGTWTYVGPAFAAGEEHIALAVIEAL